MSACHPASGLPLNSQRLARTPVIRRGDQWWLVGGSGAVLATDPVFNSQLDRFADAMAAADQAVAGLRTRHGRPPATAAGGPE